MAPQDERHIPFHGITRSDRVRVDVGRIPRKTRNRIKDLAQANKRGPEEVFDQMRRERHNVTLDEVYAVMDS